VLRLMLTGGKVRLRALVTDDLAVLEEEIFADVALMMTASGHPWRPSSLERAVARHEASLTEEEEPRHVRFAVDEIATGDLAGMGQVWGIDTHNRFAHLGYNLRPGLRGRGLGRDMIGALCDYAFRVRGLNRLQIDTAAGNAASRAAAESCGFVLEGQLRQTGWVDGAFIDEVIYGLLAHEWRARRTERS
jgi:RimJ/RimL family protein N-acetyltransferase